MQLQGANVLITGAAKRIGRQIALTLAAQGASILIHYNRSQREALTLKKEINRLGQEAFLLKSDFSSSKSLSAEIKRFVKKAYQLVPRVDVLVNNASVFYPVDFEKITEKDWDDHLTVNLKVPFFLSQQIGLKMVREKRGKIIQLADEAGFHPASRFIPYAISKAGLISATRGLAKVLAPHVQVNGVAPGPILPAKGQTPKQQRQLAQKTLLKRFGDPRDIAEAVRFLIEGSDYITGAVISVDGGRYV